VFTTAVESMNTSVATCVKKAKIGRVGCPVVILGSRGLSC